MTCFIVYVITRTEFGKVDDIKYANNYTKSRDRELTKFWTNTLK